jgi:cell division protein FtsQ
MSALNSTGGAASSQLSEVDLSDPEDVRVLLPSAGSDLLVHFGSDDFAARWQRLEQKLSGWRQQYPRLAGVDLRYQRQTVLEMAKTGLDDASASSMSTHATAAVTKPQPAKTVARSRAPAPKSGERGRMSPTHKPVNKPKPTRKPAHGPVVHRDTQT